MTARAVKVHDLLDDAGLAEGAVTVLVDRMWPRGIRKADLQPDHWLGDAAPGPGLRRWWNHDADRFDEFARRYRAELEGRRGAGGDVDELLGLAAAGDVALLYAAHDRRVNHAAVLADWLADDAGR